MDQAVKQAGSTDVQNRVAWLDAAKCIGIFLVILGHIRVKTYGFFSLGSFIFAFHMPLFFFLSGLTQKNLSFKESVGDAARKLLVPYTVFYFLAWLWWFLTAVARHPDLYSDIFESAVKKQFLGLLLASGYTTHFAITQSPYLWFCVGLFWCKVLYSLVQSKTKNPTNVNFVLTLFLLFLGFVLRYFEMYKTTIIINDFGNEIPIATRFIPFALGTLTLSYVWFFAGTLLKARLFTNETEHLPNVKRFALMVLFLALTLIVSFFNKGVDLKHYAAGADLYLYLLGATCGIAFVYELSILISPLPRFFSFLGRNTITIMAFQHITNTLPSVLFMKHIFHREPIATNENPAGIAVALLVAVVSLLLCAVPAFVFERWFPFVLGRRKRLASR